MLTQKSDPAKLMLQEKFIARQPIFDRQKLVYGYELLFRNGGKQTFDGSDPNAASCSVISDSMLLHNLEKLTNHRKAFINFTRELLCTDFQGFLPKDAAVLEILETVAPDDSVLAACHRLKESGYSLALDDVKDCERPKPFLDVVSIIKVDFMACAPSVQAQIVHQFPSHPITFVAEKVETYGDYQRAVDMGYGYYQGFFFSKPEIISRCDIPAFRWNYLRILQAIHRPEIDPGEMERIIKAEPALCYKLLRYLNSPVFGLRGEVHSIRHAMHLLGETKLKRWASLLLIASMGEDKPQELLVTALIRASWCESLAPQIGLSNREGDLFLLGLFSKIDAILDMPMSEILPQLPVADDIKAALIGGNTRLTDVLQFVDSYERADWDRSSVLATALGVEKTSIPEAYMQALDWAHQIHQLSA